MFNSSFQELGACPVPAFAGTRIMMMPLMLGDMSSVPLSLIGWTQALQRLFKWAGHLGEVGYITIDEKIVRAGTTHRRAGLHVDGLYRGHAGAWGGGPWGGGGMITVASTRNCRAWNQTFEGWPGDDGECDHLAGQCRDGASTLFDAKTAYYLEGLCVHESVPVPQDTARQFVRLSFPSRGPWFEGYTPNPLGVQPTGEILPRRRFMDDGARDIACAS